MSDFVNLRGIALSKFKTVGQFAEYMGWSRSKTTRILNGVQEPDSGDIELLVEKLPIKTPDLFMQIFFPSMSTKWTEPIYKG